MKGEASFRISDTTKEDYDEFKSQLNNDYSSLGLTRGKYDS